MKNKPWKLQKDIIVEEILPRMNGKSLHLFKCTSKFFQTLISSPQFIHRHSLQSISSDANRLILFAGKHGDIHTVDLDSPELPAVNFRTRGVNDSHLSMVGSCNGLVCLLSDLSFFIVCNPSTGMYTQFNCKIIRHLQFNHGFGFDHVDNDYKIVEVTEEYYYPSSCKREVRVYSLKSGSSSLVDSMRFEDRIKTTARNGAVIDNHLVHWRIYNAHNNEHRIGCFDLREESWTDDVALPDYDDIVPKLRNRENDLVHLGVLDGCLCLVTRTGSIPTVGFDVWVMKKYGVKDSWAKLASNLFEGHVSSLMYPLAYARGSQSKILFQVYKDTEERRGRNVHYNVQAKFFWYNVKDRTMKLAEYDELPIFDFSCVCKPSMHPVAGGVHFKIEH